MNEPLDQPRRTYTSGMPFLEHLEELRHRLIKSILAVIVTSGAAFAFSDQLITFLMRPLEGQPLHNMEVTGTFYAYLKISLIAGVVTALPIVFYQMWMFASPGLLKRERMAVLPLVLISTILFITGAAFCFYTVLPLSLNFLINFSDNLIINYITIGSYIGFAGLLLMAFGFGFQMPIVAFVLGRIGLISSRFLSKGRRYAVIIILVAAAIITPPDVFTQVLLAGPLYLLYEISILIVFLTGTAND